jgi:hypothetical protein
MPRKFTETHLPDPELPLRHEWIARLQWVDRLP